MEVWEEALDRSLLELAAGALPWQIEPAALKELRDVHFKEGFRDTCGNDPDEWAKRRDRVLRMAKCAGMLAALLADWKTGDPLKEKVTIVHLLAAMAVVRPGCGDDPPVHEAFAKAAESKIVFMGKPCQRTVISPEAKVLLLQKMAEFEVRP